MVGMKVPAKNLKNGQRIRLFNINVFLINHISHNNFSSVFIELINVKTGSEVEYVFLPNELVEVFTNLRKDWWE